MGRWENTVRSKSMALGSRDWVQVLVQGPGKPLTSLSPRFLTSKTGAVVAQLLPIVTFQFSEL